MLNSWITDFSLYIVFIRPSVLVMELNWKWLACDPVAFIGGSLFILQQFAGINGVLYFSSLTFQDVGVSSSALASLFIGLTNFAGSLCSFKIVHNSYEKILTVKYTFRGIICSDPYG